MRLEVEQRSNSPRKKGTGASSIAMPPSRRRDDIQGIRAILMAQVLLYHAWRIGSPIGVDSFIMVSAYLMTSSFLRRTEAGKMPFFVERWGNTFKRLLPPLVVVVLTTLGASLLILPADRWREITIQSFASVTYWENWRLAAVSADYYADDHALSSPLQHLWSMSMQGQIFLLWPLLMTICVVLARKLKTSPRGLVVAAFGILAALSFLWLVFFSPDDASVYFDTRSRIWEFALGSMIAALAPWIRLPRDLSGPLVSTGFIVLVVYCLVSIGDYPGPMAAVPMLCVSAILLFNPQTPKALVNRVLTWRPLVKLGNTSYAIYLVHWPIFVLYLAHKDRAQLGLFDGIALIAVSILVGWLLTKLVDDPLRKLPWSNRATANKYKMILIWLVIGLLPVSGVYQWLNTRAAKMDMANEVVMDSDGGWGNDGDLTNDIPLSGPGSKTHPGARILLGDAEANFAGIKPIPEPLTAAEQPHYDQPCPSDLKSYIGDDAARFCTVLGRAGAETTILIAGSSHAQQLLTWQVPPLVESQGWQAISVLYPACPWTSAGSYSPECSDHNVRLFDYVVSNQPDYVFLVVTQTVVNDTGEFLVPGILDLVKNLTELNIPVFGISDSIRSDQNLFECSEDRADDEPYGGCLLVEDEHFADMSLLDPLLAIDGFHYIDMRDAYCVDGICPTIIGNMMVYFDSNHVTTAYSRSIAPFFSQRVLDALGANAE